MKLIGIDHTHDEHHDRFDLVVELDDGTHRTYRGCWLKALDEEPNRPVERYGLDLIEKVTIELRVEAFDDK